MQDTEQIPDGYQPRSNKEHIVRYESMGKRMLESKRFIQHGRGRMKSAHVRPHVFVCICVWVVGGGVKRE